MKAKVCFLLLLFSAAVLQVAAQSTVATIVGHVTDASASGIPGADVHVRNVNTNAVRVVQSDTVGDYTVTNLPAGRYEVSIEKQGFRRLKETNLELQVNQTARLDVILEVGAVTESIQVTEAPPVLNTENAVKGDVVVHQEIVEMPLNGRSIEDLAFLVPEVADASDSNSGSSMAANGARNDNTTFLIDGINNNDLREGGSLATVPLDAVQEFKMQTSGFSAEFGKLAGGVMTVALKTGGNKPHGSLFEFLRNDKMDARNFFAGTKDKLRRNQFGGSLDGPVYIPKLYNGRDRTFIVFTWESYRQVTGASKLAAVPTELERVGDFSQSRAANGALVTVKDPLGGTFAGARIPASRFNPVAAKLVTYYPRENRPGQLNNYLATANDRNTFDSLAIKGDHKLSEKDMLAVRYLHRDPNGGNAFSGSDLGNLGAKNHNPNWLLGITETRLITPAFINEFRGGFSRETRHGQPRDVGTDMASVLGIPGTTNDPHLTGFPKFTVKNYAILGDPNAQPFEPVVNIYTWADTVTWVKGRHLLKFGGEAARSQMFQAANDNARGTFKIQDTWTGVPMGDLLLGLLNQSSRQVGVNRTYNFVTQVGPFIQDDIKILPQLTLNLGLRYEYAKPIYDKYDRFANFVPELHRIVLADSRGVNNLPQLLTTAGMTNIVELAKDAGLPRSLVNGRDTNFAPRFGFAWRPGARNRTVLRGGYGIFYAGSYLGGIKGDLGNTFPFAIKETYNKVTSNANALTLSNPFPAALASLTGTTDASGHDTNPPAQYMQSWNLTMEREVGKATAIEAGYAGSKGTHLGRKYNINQPFRTPAYLQANGSFLRPEPIFNTINYYSYGSNSSYSAGTFTIRHRLSKGVFFRASYVFSKTIDDASFISGSSTAGYAGAQDARNLWLERARSDFDSRHVFTMNFTWETPRSLNKLLRGWQLAGTGRAASGQPFTPQISGAKPEQGEPNRPDRIANGKLDNPTPDRWFDVTAFTPVPLTAYRFGTAGRNILDGPGMMTINLALSKRFRLGERQSLQFRWEAFNFSNHTNLKQPVVAMDTPTAATITSAGDARVMQLGLRFQF